jgi:hypothetical protein
VKFFNTDDVEIEEMVSKINDFIKSGSVKKKNIRLFKDEESTTEGGSNEVAEVDIQQTKALVQSFTQILDKHLMEDIDNESANWNVTRSALQSALQQTQKEVYALHRNTLNKDSTATRLAQLQALVALEQRLLHIYDQLAENVLEGLLHYFQRTLSKYPVNPSLRSDLRQLRENTMRKYRDILQIMSKGKFSFSKYVIFFVIPLYWNVY